MSDTEPPAMPVLALEGVTVRFGGGRRVVTALDAVTFEQRRGSVVGLVGPDGAGKTTLMRVVAGLLPPAAGRIRLLGEDVAAQPEKVTASIGYMPQRFGLYEELSVVENLDLYADLQGVPRGERSERYDALLGMTGLAPFLDRLAGNLSGGMKRKLGLACALIRTPRLLLLDEPTVGVDPVSRRELWAIVERMVGEAGVDVLVSTAYLDETVRCDAVVVLDRGRVLDSGSPQMLMRAVAGRVFVAPRTGEGLREAASRIATDPEVVDAVPERGRIRVVLRPSSPARAHPDGLDPVPVRFEDYFVDALARVGRMAETVPPTSLGPPRAADASGAVIEVAEVWRRFGAFAAVKGVSFEVRRGEIFGLLGANGAGKSTLFRMLCGLLPASAGRLRVGGVDMGRARAAARARLGYVAQRFSLYATLTVAQNLRFFAAAYGLAGRRRAARVREVMEEFDLLDLADVDGGDLSLGYRQRLALASALMHEPEILFLDEATSGVDPLARREFWRRINALASAGVTVLVTTHFMEEAEYCDRLVVMNAGTILAEGSPDAIRARAVTADLPEPTMEDAFIALLESRATAEAA
ncbi:MAG: ABC transporter ATP-binding protein [Ectothiorhodospiraceae bacterium]|nr:ABC transporter ATP-binding protein [Ectothiorhodospiraceae bacterium]